MKLICLICAVLLALSLTGGAAPAGNAFVVGHIMIAPNATSGTLTFANPFANGLDCAFAPYSQDSDASAWVTASLAGVTVTVEYPSNQPRYFGVLCAGS